MPELIQYVDSNGAPTGETAEKLAAHHDHTRKHLAFSFYGFDDYGQFLATQRAHVKKVWPDVWTNTCCGHPMPGESPEDAIRRRLRDELGIAKVTDLRCVLPDYSYQTPPYNGIIENEFCPVYVGRVGHEFVSNPQEVEAYEWLDWAEWVARLAANPSMYSYWTKEQTKLLGAPAESAKLD